MLKTRASVLKGGGEYVLIATNVVVKIPLPGGNTTTTLIIICRTTKVVQSLWRIRRDAVITHETVTSATLDTAFWPEAERYRHGPNEEPEATSRLERES